MKFLADENFHGPILRAIRQRLSKDSVLRVQDVGLRCAADEKILQWAADHDCILLTHDLKTMGEFLYDRVRLGLPAQGVFQVNPHASIQLVVDDLLLIAECSSSDEWSGRLTFIPF